MDGFHLIGFPSEWGESWKLLWQERLVQQFPFNWVPQRVGSEISSYFQTVHGNGYKFPFNWVPQRVGSEDTPASETKLVLDKVSI